MEERALHIIQDVEDFVSGCTLMGTGGGGNPNEGFAILEEVFREKGVIEWHDVNTVDDDAVVLCTFLMGSSAPMTEKKEHEMAAIGLEGKTLVLRQAVPSVVGLVGHGLARIAHECEAPGVLVERHHGR